MTSIEILLTNITAEKLSAVTELVDSLRRDLTDGSLSPQRECKQWLYIYICVLVISDTCPIQNEIRP